MPDADPLSLRKITPDAVALARGLVETATADDPESESFGVENLGSTLPANGWAVWIGDGMASAAWMSVANGKAEVKAVAVPKGRKGMGLTGWILTQLAEKAGEEGCAEIVANISSKSARLGEILADAGFSGPDKKADDFPAGQWSRQCR